jgi:putative membrane protein
MFSSWSLKKFNATVINDIWPEVLFFSAVAAMVALVTEKTEHKLEISTTLLTVLGTVLGLVISFRTSSAYERYQDGRKLWTSIQISSRNMAMLIWIHVPTDRRHIESQKHVGVLQATIEKKTMINLVQAFSVAVKHYLRGEPGVYYKDLFPLVSFLPRYVESQPGHRSEQDMLPLWHSSEDDFGDATLTHRHHPADAPHTTGHAPSRTASLPTPNHHDHSTVNDDLEKPKFNSWGRKKTKKFDPEQVLPDVSPGRPLKPARNPPQSNIYDYIPLLRLFKWIFRRSTGIATSIRGEGTRTLMGRKRKPPVVDSNVPLEVSLYLSTYTSWLMQSGLLQPAVASAFTTHIATMQDTLTNLERIRSTPLPFAYQAHLRISLWLYLFFLPFQVHATFGYLTIPGTAFAAFLLLGFLEIGAEIENPFNYDANDLDLDHFCLSIQRELHEITAHTAPNPATYVLSPWNQPFAPADRRTAEDLMKQGGDVYAPPQGAHPTPRHEANGNDHSADHNATISSLRSTLLRSWKDVDVHTRDDTRWQ